MAKYIRTLTVITDTEIKQKEVPLFRGAVLKNLGEKANLLFHNHTGENTFRYSYPLIQYKRIHGKAAIVCVEEGADVIGQFFLESASSFNIGERRASCRVEKVIPSKILVQTWQQSFEYHVNCWLPLNSANYQTYISTESVVERMVLLEKILKGNLLAMLKGINIHIDDLLEASITNISEPYTIENKGVRLMAFNIDFSSNLSIPNNIGIGKNASLGYGTIHQVKTENESKKQN